MSNINIEPYYAYIRNQPHLELWVRNNLKFKVQLYKETIKEILWLESVYCFSGGDNVIEDFSSVQTGGAGERLGLQWCLSHSSHVKGPSSQQEDREIQSFGLVLCWTTTEVRVCYLRLICPVKLSSVFAPQRLRRVINPARAGRRWCPSRERPQGVGRHPAVVSGSFRLSASVVLQRKPDHRLAAVWPATRQNMSTLLPINVKTNTLNLDTEFKTAHFRVAFCCEQPKAHLCTNHSV